MKYLSLYFCIVIWIQFSLIVGDLYYDTAPVKWCSMFKYDIFQDFLYFILC